MEFPRASTISTLSIASSDKGKGSRRLKSNGAGEKRGLKPEQEVEKDWAIPSKGKEHWKRAERNEPTRPAPIPIVSPQQRRFGTQEEEEETFAEPAGREETVSMRRKHGPARTCAAYTLMGLGERLAAGVEKPVRPVDNGDLRAVAPVLSKM